MSQTPYWDRDDGEIPSAHRQVAQGEIDDDRWHATRRYDSGETIPGDEVDRGGRNQVPAVVDPEATDGGGAHRGGYGETGYRRSHHEEATYYEHDDYRYEHQEADDRYYAANPPHGGNVYDARRLPDDVLAEAGSSEPTTARRRAGNRRAVKRAHGKVVKPSRRTGRRSVPVLAIVLGVLALILIAFNAYIFLPILLGSDPSRSVATAVPPKVEDRLEALDTPGAASARIVSDSATAVEIPERNLSVTESLVIFNGDQPTVLEGTTNNPIKLHID
jgi:hypothetical protein